MEYNPVQGRSPKKEEQQVPDYVFPKLLPDSSTPHSSHDFTIMDELGDGVLSGSEHKHTELLQHHCYGDGQLIWDFMELEGFSAVDAEEAEVAEDDDEGEEEGERSKWLVENDKIIKTENNGGLWEEDDDEKIKSLKLNLNLNYQEVLDAWSDRGSLWADESSLLLHSNNGLCYMGEVPIMGEDRRRRNASVRRYKEKRQSRLFSKKIRYQVRKLNADKRPRLKGRFVKKRL